MNDNQDPQVSQTVLRDLFTLYDAKEAQLIEAKLAVEAALKERSEVVNQIAKLIAPKKKVLRHGKELTICFRGETTFFRGAGKNSEPVEV
jgi:hypothetical protein